MSGDVDGYAINPGSVPYVQAYHSWLEAAEGAKKDRAINLDHVGFLCALSRGAYNGNNKNGDRPAKTTVRALADRYGLDPKTVRGYIDACEAAGFLKVGVPANPAEPNVYGIVADPASDVTDWAAVFDGYGVTEREGKKGPRPGREGKNGPRREGKKGPRREGKNGVGVDQKPAQGSTKKRQGLPTNTKNTFTNTSTNTPPPDGDEDTSDPADEPTEAKRLCYMLAARIQAHHGNDVDPPRITSTWIEEMDRLIRIGGLDPDTEQVPADPAAIERVIDATFDRLNVRSGSGFCWADQIRSAPTFRQQWNKLRAALNAQQQVAARRDRRVIDDDEAHKAAAQLAAAMNGTKELTA